MIWAVIFTFHSVLWKFRLFYFRDTAPLSMQFLEGGGQWVDSELVGEKDIFSRKIIGIQFPRTVARMVELWEILHEIWSFL